MDIARDEMSWTKDRLENEIKIIFIEIQKIPRK